MEKVTSSDGTPIAYWSSGSGPDLVVVHGTSADHTRREEVVVALLREIAGLTDEQVEWSRADPSWAGRVAAAHTVVRETRAVEAYRFEPARFAGVAVPTLLLTGSETGADFAESTTLLAEALPDARVVTLAGQGHVAMLTAPALVATEILGFLQGR